MISSFRPKIDRTGSIYRYLAAGFYELLSFRVVPMITYLVVHEQKRTILNGQL